MARKRKLSVSEAGMLPLADYVNVPKADIATTGINAQ